MLIQGKVKRSSLFYKEYNDIEVNVFKIQKLLRRENGLIWKGRLQSFYNLMSYAFFHAPA